MKIYSTALSKAIGEAASVQISRRWSRSDLCQVHRGPRNFTAAQMSKSLFENYGWVMRRICGDGQPGLSDAAREKLLRAIAKARRWMRDMTEHRCTFDDIADREGCGERHVRFLAPLAFLSPKIVQAISDGNAPPDLTISVLARTLPHDWAEQERCLA